MSPKRPVHFLLFIISSSWILSTFTHTYAVPMPSRLPPPYSDHSPSHSGLSEALSGPPPPSYSRDMVFRVLNDQKYARAWMISVYEHDPAVRVTSFDMTFYFTRTLSYKCKSPETRNARKSAICIAPDPHNKRAEVTIKVLQQFDRSALSEVSALKHFSYLLDSGLLKGKPTIITRKSPGVPLQKTDAWTKNPRQRENLREQVRTKVRAQVLLWALGDKLLYIDLHWENFLVEMTKDDQVKEVHIFNFEYPLLQVNFLNPYTTRSELEAWFNAYWDYRVDSGHWESDLG